MDKYIRFGIDSKQAGSPVMQNDKTEKTNPSKQMCGTTPILNLIYSLLNLNLPFVP